MPVEVVVSLRPHEGCRFDTLSTTLHSPYAVISSLQEGQCPKLVFTTLAMANAHLSPRKSMTYATTPPGILTSTRTSTREKALKQLCAHISTVHVVTSVCAPVRPALDFPSRPLGEPCLWFFDRVCEGVDVGSEGSRRGCIDAGDVVVRAELLQHGRRWRTWS